MISGIVITVSVWLNYWQLTLMFNLMDLHIVGFLSATLWAFLLRVTKTSIYVPYDILVE